MHILNLISVVYKCHLTCGKKNSANVSYFFLTTKQIWELMQWTTLKKYITLWAKLGKEINKNKSMQEVLVFRHYSFIFYFYCSILHFVSLFRTSSSLRLHIQEVVLLDRHLKANSQSRSVCWGHSQTFTHRHDYSDLYPAISALRSENHLAFTIYFSLFIYRQRNSSLFLITNHWEQNGDEINKTLTWMAT